MTESDKEAYAAHEKRLEWAKMHSAQIQTFASDAMKAPALVALGGVVALLGFYSANFARLSRDAAAMDAFGSMLFWLFTSLVMTVAAPGLAYFSQIAYTASIFGEHHHMDRPYVRQSLKSRLYSYAGDLCRWTAAALIAASIACLIRSGLLFFTVVGLPKMPAP